MNSTMYVPTILIGVGGVGSTIVSNIFGRLTKEMTGKVSVLCLDTDINWINNLEYVEDQNIIRLSPQERVGSHLKRLESQNDKSFKEWFQDDILELKRKNMTDGAGQVRTISRLAFNEAVKSGAIKKLQSEINRISEQFESPQDNGVRVCLVGTLAGGTGSGIFLQIALLLRKLLKDSRQESVLTIGYFLLGGILEGVGAISKPNEVDNIYANTYASFKELNALNKRASSRKGHDLDFEVFPGRDQLQLDYQDLPFDYYHVIDHKNTAGNNLKNFEAYIKVLENNVYTYLFTKQADGAFSKLDNQITSIIESEGEARACGSAAGRIFYPYDDVLRLFSLKRTIASVSQVWTKFDGFFERDMQEYHEKRNRGDVSAEKPVLKMKYPFYLKNEVEGKQNPDPNFVLINNQLKLFDETKGFTGYRHEAFIESIRQRIDDLTQQDENLLPLFKTIELDYDKLKNIENTVEAVQHNERTLDTLEKVANEFVNNHSNLASDILYDDSVLDLSNIEIYNGENFYLNYWVLSENTLHPIALRVFIYETINELDLILAKKKNQLKKKIRGLKIAEAYFKADDPGDFKAYLYDHIREVQDIPTSIKPFLLRAKLRSFIDEYADNLNRRRSLVKDITMLRVSVTTYEKLVIGLLRLSVILEKFFNSLLNILDNIQSEATKLTIKYNEAGGYEKVVLGTEDLLNKFWKSERSKLTSFDELPEGLSKSLYAEFYNMLVKKSTNENFQVKFNESFKEKLKESMVSNNKKFMKSGKVPLDLNIMEALKKEYELGGSADDAEFERFFKVKLNGLQNMVIEFGPDGGLIDSDASFYSMWGMNLEVYELIPKSIKDELNAVNDADGGSFINDYNISKREIIRAKILMGQTLQRYASFRAPEGKYYQAYNKRILKLGNPEIQAITPHLDKRWHLPQFLPEIFEDMQERRQKRIAELLLKSLMTQKISNVSVGHVPAWTFNGEVMLDENQEEIRNSDISALLRGIQFNLHLWQSIETEFQQLLHRDLDRDEYLRNSEILNHSKNIKIGGEELNILDVIIKYSRESSSNQESFELLLSAFREILTNLIKAYHSDFHEEKVDQERQEIFNLHYKRHSNFYKILKEDAQNNTKIRRVDQLLS